MKSNAESNPAEYKKPNTIELNTDIFNLLHLLESNMPLSRQKIMDMGFKLTRIEKGPRRGSYSVAPVALNDGVLLNKIRLSVRNAGPYMSMYILLNIKNKVITRQEIENLLGKFVLVPKEDTISEETTVYVKIVEESDITAVYEREAKGALLRISFGFVEPLEQ